MKKFLKYTFAALVSFGLVSCNEDEVLADWTASNPVPTATVPTGAPGTADLSDLVVLGTSFASGFQDGSLYNDGQANSFPALLGTQFQVSGVGGTANFGQPDINSENGFNVFLDDPAYGRTVLDLSELAPVPTSGDQVSVGTPWSGTTSSLNNFSAPTMQSAQLISAPHAAANAFYGRFASDAGNSTPLSDALSAQGTFFIYEAGLNDVALYAAGGGTNDIGPLTGSAEFEGYVDLAIHGLASAGATLAGRADGASINYSIEGVVLNVPPILAFPFFQAVAYNAVPLDQATADVLNTSFASVNGAIDGAVQAGWTGDGADARDLRKVSYAAGNNPILVVDESLDDLGPYWDGLVSAMQMSSDDRAKLEPYRQSRPLVQGEIVPLSTAPLLGEEADGDDTVADTPMGIAIPLGFSLTMGQTGGDKYYLTLAEQQEIEITRAAYNTALAGAVADVNSGGGEVVLVDIEAIFRDAAGLSDGELGIRSQGLNLSPDFTPNGIFSTDGIHPCQRGYGLVANAIIDAINDQWGASVPSVGISTLAPPPFQP